MRENYFYISNYTYQSKDISIPIHSFSTLFHNGRYFVNEISVTFDLEGFGINILYLEISTPYLVCYSLLLFHSYKRKSKTCFTSNCKYKKKNETNERNDKNMSTSIMETVVNINANYDNYLTKKVNSNKL